MKKIIFVLIFISACFAVFSQESNKPEAWKYKDAELLVGEEESDIDLTAQGKLLQVIPTGKRRQSYVFVFGIMQETDEIIVIDDGSGSEPVSFSKKAFRPVEFELWADEGGDSLLEYLKCNTELPYSFAEEGDAEKYNSPEYQPCIGTAVKLKYKIRQTEDSVVYILLEVENQDNNIQN